MEHKPLGREPFSIIPPEDLAKIMIIIEDLAGEFGNELEQPPKRNGSNGIEAPRPGIKLMPFDEIEIGAEPFCLIEGLIPRVGLTVILGPAEEREKLLDVRRLYAHCPRLELPRTACAAWPGGLLRV